MERELERKRKRRTVDNTLLAEISTILETPISVLKTYPPQTQELLISTYINSYDADKATKISALTQVVNLFYDEKDIAPAAISEQKPMIDNKYKLNAVLTRSDIVKTSAAIMRQSVLGSNADNIEERMSE